jgi:hypothetical protein
LASCKEMSALQLVADLFRKTRLGRLFTLRLAGHPLPPDLLESWDYGHTTTKIFELEGLICKIFQTNELAGLRIIFGLTVQLHD